MDQEQLVVAQEAEALERQVWDGTEPELQALAVTLPSRFRARGVTAREVLARFTDEGLVLAVRKDLLAAEAFEELLENRYKRLLLRWAFHWGLPFQDAEDLVHTLFVKFWKTRFRIYQPVGDGGANFRAFLWTVARNRWVQDGRRKRAVSLDGCPEPSADGGGAAQRLLGAELQEQIDQALKQMSATDQHILRAILNDRPIREIALELDLSYLAVTMRLYRLRNKLEQTLGLSQRGRASRRSS